MTDHSANWHDFLAPKYWGSWLLIALLRIIALLPFRLGLALGAVFGRILYHLLTSRRHIVEVNVRLCFAEQSEQQQRQFCKDIFRANGIGLVETAWAYWGDMEAFRDRTTVIGAELVTEALAQGKGLIVLGAHFSTLDLGGVLFGCYGIKANFVYRRHNNPLMEYMITRKRSRFSTVIERKKFRQMIRCLRNNESIWYAPDQDFGRKSAVYVPFFGHPAATIVGTSKMVRLNNSPILMVSHHRRADNSGYIIEMSKVPGFPSGDETRDAAIVNSTIEREIRKYPEQYMWVHRRFKTQPDGKHKLYR